MFAPRLAFLRVIPSGTYRDVASKNLRSRFSNSAGVPIVRKAITKEERAALRAARRERAAEVLQAQAGDTAVSTGSATTNKLMASRWIWYASVALPSAILVWGFTDENSPPAKFSEMIGLTGLIQSYTDEIAKPSHDKLLPDWSQVSYQFLMRKSSYLCLRTGSL